MAMDTLAKLTKHHCILLAVHLARDSNVTLIQNLTATRRDAFTNELALRILLTCLPESVEPSTYTDYVEGIASNVWEAHDSTIPDTSAVKHLSTAVASKRVKKLRLLPLAHPSCQSWETKDLLTLFLVHRAYLLDEEADLLVFVPQLVGPFIDRSAELKMWFIATVLPLLRLSYEYYTQTAETPSLEDFNRIAGLGGVVMLMSRSQQSGSSEEEGTYNGARDLRGLVGPWMYGSSARKRRKLDGATRRASIPPEAGRDVENIDNYGASAEKLSTRHEWEQVFEYLVQEATKNFPFVTETMECWNGPGDIDLGGFDDAQPDLDFETQKILQIGYTQAIFAAVYAGSTATLESIEAAHRLLVRIADLMQLGPPPDLVSSVDMLPKLDSQVSALSGTTTAVLLPNVLLRTGHPLTTPNSESYALLQIFIYTAHLLDGLQNSTSVCNVARLRFHSNADEQFSLLQKILHLSASGSRKDVQQWNDIRQRIKWLWSWGLSTIQGDNTQHGEGILGKVEKRTLEKEILKTFLSAGCFGLITDTYVNPQLDHPTRDLPSKEEVEEAIVASAMQFYDNASNGNRTRGGMKKASDIISTFRKIFPRSPELTRSEALLAATHALSFYSLTLQHGVPFQPVSIRVSQDPLSLLQKVLEQNPQSYSKLDDLIATGRNLVAAGLMDKASEDPLSPALSKPEDPELHKAKAERRIIGMAIEQALVEDDFETAYSYVVNRLNPAGTSTAEDDSIKPEEDDLSWRAAFLAGRHRSAADLSSTFSTGSTNLRKPGLRRLEQRMELLSQSLMLAPPPHLPEVLAAWRRCEEEMGVLLAEEAEEEETFEDKTIPGGFGPSTSPVQTRREVGRGAIEESPMGLFDVARGAAAAFSRSTFPLHSAAGQARNTEGSAPGTPTFETHPQGTFSGAGSDTASIGSGQDRVRKRDMVANAATGALASGLGWVLGATPVNQHEPRSP